MANSTSSASAGSAAERRAALILGFLCWALAPAAVVGQEEAPSPQQKAEQEIALADAAVRRVQQLRQHLDFGEASRRAGEELESSLERARRLLATAKSGLESAVQRQSATGFSDAALLARRATRELDAYEEHLRDLFRQIETERSPPPPPPPPMAREEATGAPEPEASRAPPAEAGAATVPDAAEAPVAAPDVEAPPAEPPPAEPPPAKPPSTKPPSAQPPPVQPPTAQPPTAAEPPPAKPPPAQPPAVEASPPPTRRTPPRQLRQAADAYFAGDYERTIALLTEARFRAAKARGHALLLRAAARYALFLLGGETDYALRGLATEDIAACRRADPTLAPSEDMFSPRFRDFFAATAPTQ